MPKEVIFEGFKVMLPFEPETERRLMVVWNGVSASRELLERAKLFVPEKQRQEILAALEELKATLAVLIESSRVLAGRSSVTPPK